MTVFFVYAPRRVDCPACGVRVERMPWAEGKQHLTQAYAWFLASWVKRLCWKEVAEAFRMSWDSVFRAVEMAVDWGRAYQDLAGLGAIGVEEIAWQRGHRSLTLVSQIDIRRKRLLWVVEKRTVKTLLRFFRWVGRERSQALPFICSDRWTPYLKVIVLDRFHFMAHLNKAIDKVRSEALCANISETPAPL